MNIVCLGFPEFKSLKNFRQMRALRILNVIKTSDSMKIIIHALYKTIPSLLNLFLIVCFVILLISINTMSKWKGTFFSCENFEILQKSQIFTKNDCLKANGEWINKKMNFDSIKSSCLLFFFIIVGSDWLEIMYSSIDSVGIDEQPIYNHHPYIILLFYSFILFGSILLFNLFVGVVIDNFNQMKEIVGGYLVLTPEQKEWVDLQRFILRKRLKILIKKPDNFIRGILYEIAMNKFFDAGIFIFILINFVIMASVYKGMSQEFENFIYGFNFFILVLYNIEITIKIIAFGLLFFKDSWNM